MDATIVDLRYRMKEVLRAIDRGETVTVLHRGKARARLEPVVPSSDTDMPSTKDQPLFGLWKDRDEMADPVSWVRSLRRPRPAPAQTGGRKRSDARRSG